MNYSKCFVVLKLTVASIQFKYLYYTKHMVESSYILFYNKTRKNNYDDLSVIIITFYKVTQTFNRCVNWLQGEALK